MKKNKILLAAALFVLAGYSFAHAWVDMWNLNADPIRNVSIAPVWWSGFSEKLNNATFSVLHTIKVIFSWIILAYLVFLWFQMIMAMWDESKLSAAKRQIYYTLIAFLFINIPWQVYWVFSWKNNEDVTSKWQFTSVTTSNSDSNIIVNFFNWNSTVENWIISFIKVIIIWLVTMLFIMAWIWLISSHWNEEKRKKARTRFINWVLWLIFIWVIQAWTTVAYSWDIPKWQWLFSQLANLALFFAGPITIFFLILWWFYYITSAWDEGKTKKWLAILKNTFIAVIILLAWYAFLKDLSDFIP